MEIPEWYDQDMSMSARVPPTSSSSSSSTYLNGTQHCLLSPPSGEGVHSIRLRVRNEQGLHARPAAYIVKILSRFQARVTLTYRKKTVDAKSVLGILLLAAPKNSTIIVHAVGHDVDSALQELEKAFSSSFEGAL